MDEALKQRLVGAVILIALAVIFLPMLLTGTDRDNERKSDAELALPPRPEAPTRQRRLPLEPERSSTSEGTAATQPSGAGAGREAEPPDAVSDEADGEMTATLQTPAGEPARRSAESAGETAPAPESTATKTPSGQPGTDRPANAADAGAAISETEATTSQTVPGARRAGMPTEQGWVIQVASLADPDNVARLVASLSGLGFEPGRDLVQGGDANDLHRVWVGPFESRQQVETAMRKIRDGIEHVEPQIRGAAPAATESVGTTAADDDPRFAVQMGVFAAEENAAKLRQRLLGAGYSAATRRVESNGEVRYRVLVGPLLSRSDADHIRGRINSDVEIEGMIVEYP